MAAPLPVGENAALARENALPDEEKHMRSALLWIGFPHAIVRKRICNEIGVTFQDVQQLKEADITSLASSFSKRTPANTRIMFGQRRIRRLKAFIHWTKDFRRTSLPVSIDIKKGGISFVQHLTTKNHQNQLHIFSAQMTPHLAKFTADIAVQQSGRFGGPASASNNSSAAQMSLNQ